MQRYFFDIHESDERAVDEEGVLFPTIEKARSAAISSLGDLVRDRVRGGELLTQLLIEVRTDEHPVFAISADFKIFSLN